MKVNHPALMLLACILLAPSLARAQSELVAQVQAADVLSDLLTYTNGRADLRDSALTKFIADSGKDAAFAQFKSTAPVQKPLAFSQIFQGAVDYIKKGGDKFANPTIKTMSEPQLSSELSELQVYNIQQFMQLSEKKKKIDAMREYLKSTGELEKYQKWSKDFMVGLPPVTSVSGVGARMEDIMKVAKAIAWSKAEARGVTKEDFEKQWQKQVEQYKDGVAAKVAGVKDLAKSLSEPASTAPSAGVPAVPAPPTFTPAAVPLLPQGPPPPSITAAPPPPTVQSAYSNTQYQSQNYELWNRFDDD